MPIMVLSIFLAKRPFKKLEKAEIFQIDPFSQKDIKIKLKLYFSKMEENVFKLKNTQAFRNTIQLNYIQKYLLK